MTQQINIRSSQMEGKFHHQQKTATVRHETTRHENCLVVRIHSNPYQEFGAELVLLLEGLLDRVDKDPDIGAIAFSSRWSQLKD